MRWQFLYDEDDVDFYRKKATLSLIGSWWAEFEQRAASIIEALERRDPPDDLVEFIREHLDPISESFMWEIERLEGGDFLLVITPEHAPELQAVADDLIARAPSVPGWQFSSCRRPSSPDYVRTNYEARVGNKYPDDLTVELSLSTANQIDLSFRSRSFSADSDEEDLIDMITLASIVLGEEVANTWTGMFLTIAVARNPLGSMFSSLMPGGGRSEISESGAELLPADSFARQFMLMVDEIVSALPETPLAQIVDPGDDKPVTVFSVSAPEGATDLPERLTAGMWVPSVYVAVNESVQFSSRCLSKCDELFCYLKTLNTADEAERGASRNYFERAIDAALRARGLGCTIGGGMGFEYDFLDLALTDVDSAVEVIRSVCREQRLSPQSWLLFYDARWCEEWVGLLPDTPPPVLSNQPD